MRILLSRKERFWKKVDKNGPLWNGTPCWLWTGAKFVNFGYGMFWKPEGATWERAHRVAWELTNGPVPDGMFVLHHCDNPPCVNPGHLFLGTHKDNMHDMKVKKRAAAGDRNRCAIKPESILRGAEHGRALVTAEDVQYIRLQYAHAAAGGKDKIMRELAVKFGLSYYGVRNIIVRRTWKHIE